MVPIFIHYNPSSERWIVTKPSHWSLAPVDCRWMDNDVIGDTALIPQINIVEEEYIYDGQQNALLKIAELYTLQIIEKAKEQDDE